MKRLVTSRLLALSLREKPLHPPKCQRTPTFLEGSCIRSPCASLLPRVFCFGLGVAPSPPGSLRRLRPLRVLAGSGAELSHTEVLPFRC